MGLNPHLTSGKQYVDAALGQPDLSTAAHLPDCETCARSVLAIRDLLTMPGYTPNKVEQIVDSLITSNGD